MTPFPAPQHGRSAFYKGKINHIALAKDSKTVTPLITFDPAFRVSVDAKRWRKALLRGDIRNALRSDGPLGKCFVPVKIITFKGWTIIAGSLNRLVPPGPIYTFENQAAIYIGRGGYRFDKVELANDLLNPNASGIVDIAANDDYVAAIARNGVMYYWSGVGSWQTRTDLPLGVSPTTNRQTAGIGAAPAGFTVVGAFGNNDGSAGAARLISGATPAATFTVRTLPTMDAPAIAAKGNVMLAASPTSPDAKQRIVTSGLSDLATWAAAGLAISGGIEFMLHNGTRWIGGGGYNKQLLSSTAGSSAWSVVADPAKTPWGSDPADHPVINSAYVAGGKFHLHWGHYGGPTDGGGMAISADGDTWERILAAAAGLEARPYLIGTLLAA